MKKFFPYILTVVISGCTLLKAQTICSVKFPAEADVKVYVAHGSGANPDLVVYKVGTADSAGTNNGLWYFTTLSSAAQKKIYFDMDSTDADMKIQFTNTIGNAGWLNSSKTPLMN